MTAKLLSDRSIEKKLAACLSKEKDPDIIYQIGVVIMTMCKYGRILPELKSGVAKACQRLKGDHELVSCVERVEREKTLYPEPVITVFTHCAASLQQGHEYAVKLSAIEREQIRAFGEVPKRPPPPLPSKIGKK